MSSLAPTPDQITARVIEQYQSFLNPTQVALLKIGGFDHVEHRGEGVYLYDLDGNKYIDCLGSYGVFSLGHCHPRVIAAVKHQLDLMPMGSKTFLNKPLADLAEKLASITPGNLQYSFICNSGTEAVEGALKLARMATGRTNIVATTDAFHGKTMGALSASGRDLYKHDFEPLVPGFVRIPWNDVKALTDSVNSSTAALILEPIQGEGGIRIPDLSFMETARRVCTEHGALLILDEVQTGLGRTGKMFACEHFNIVPDIMTLAKALGGGVMPIGAFVAASDVWLKMFQNNPFIHSSTFGGGELACCAALAAIQATEDEGLVKRSAESGEYFRRRLVDAAAEFPGLLKEVRGLGLMIGIEFEDSDVAKLVIGAMVHRGVIAAYTLNNPTVIRIEPPLIITQLEIDQVISVFRDSMIEARDLIAGLFDE